MGRVATPFVSLLMFALVHCVCIIQHLHPSLQHSFDATTPLHHTGLLSKRKHQMYGILFPVCLWAMYGLPSSVDPHHPPCLCDHREAAMVKKVQRFKMEDRVMWLETLGPTYMHEHAHASNWCHKEVLHPLCLQTELLWSLDPRHRWLSKINVSKIERPQN